MNANEILNAAPGTKMQMTFDVDGFSLKARPNAVYGRAMVVKNLGQPRKLSNGKLFRSVTFELNAFGSEMSTTIAEGDETFRVIP